MAFAADSPGDGFGFVVVASHRVPPTPFLAGERVESVVGDDVEAVLALHDVGHRPSVDDFDANPKRPTAGRSCSGLTLVVQCGLWWHAKRVRLACRGGGRATAAHAGGLPRLRTDRARPAHVHPGRPSHRPHPRRDPQHHRPARPRPNPLRPRPRPAPAAGQRTRQPHHRAANPALRATPPRGPSRRARPPPTATPPGSATSSALFLTTAAGIPGAFVEQWRQSPVWAVQEAFAHTRCTTPR